MFVSNVKYSNSLGGLHRYVLAGPVTEDLFRKKKREREREKEKEKESKGEGTDMSRHELTDFSEHVFSLHIARNALDNSDQQ